MGSAVGIKRTEEPLLFDHCAQTCHDRVGRFLRCQLRIIDLAGGIVQNHNQVVPALILEPLMFAAINVQHHTWQRTPLASLAMHPALGLALHQTGYL